MSTNIHQRIFAHTWSSITSLAFEEYNSRNTFDLIMRRTPNLQHLSIKDVRFAPNLSLLAQTALQLRTLRITVYNVPLSSMLVLDSTSQPPAFLNIQEFTVHICLTHNPTRTVQSLTRFVTHCLPNLQMLKLTSFADPLDYANFDDNPEYLKEMGLPIKRKELDIGLITKVVAFATKLRELTLPYGSDEMLLQLQHQYPLLYIKRD